MLALADGSLIVRGETDELVQVCQNLVENACKYGQSGGRIEFGAILLDRPAEPGMTEVFVRDFGPGIGAEHLPRLTERFYRVDIVESRQKQGTGLGLAIVKHIINQHRGRLQISSIEGKGSIFTVHLPYRG